MSRDTRDLLSDRDSTFIVLSIDIKDMPLRILVAEKSSFELCQNRLKLGYQPTSNSNISRHWWPPFWYLRVK